MLTQLEFKHTNKTRDRPYNSEEEDITSDGKNKGTGKATFELVLQIQCLDLFASSHMERNVIESENKNPGPVSHDHNKYIVQLRVAR